MNVINKPQKEFDNDIEYHLPKYLVNHKYYKNLYDKKHREFVKVITGLENSKDVDEDKLNKYRMSRYPFIKVGNKFLHFYSEWSIMKLIPINMKGFINII